MQQPPKNVPNGISLTKPVVTPEEPPKLPSLPETYATWQASQHDEDFANVMKALEPTVQRGLKAYGDGRQDLRTRARILAAEAVKTYDPKKAGKAQLSTYVHSHLQRLQRVSADRSAAVRLPERSRMDAIVIRDAVREYMDKEGHEPDVVTLSEMTGISRSRQKLAADAYKEISEAGLETEKGDTLLQGTVDDGEDAWRDYVYHDLDAKSRKILEWTTGYGGSRTLPKQEIAKRLRMTPAAVSSRIQTIISRLEDRPSGRV